MTGWDKLTPLVIGKSKKPRYLTTMKPTVYMTSSIMWMTVSVIESYLCKGMHGFISKRILDNCMAHSSLGWKTAYCPYIYFYLYVQVSDFVATKSCIVRLML